MAFRIDPEQQAIYDANDALAELCAYTDEDWAERPARGTARELETFAFSDIDVPF